MTTSVYYCRSSFSDPIIYKIATKMGGAKAEKMDDLQKFSNGFYFQGSNGHFLIDYDGASFGNQTIWHLSVGSQWWSDLQLLDLDEELRLLAGCFL